MSEQITALVLNAIGLAVSTLIAIVGFLLKRSITDKLDLFDIKLQKIDDNVTNTKIEMVKEYIRKEDYNEAQKNLREDIRELEKQIAGLAKAG